MSPSAIRRRAQALVNHQLSAGNPIDTEKLVSQLEKIPGVTAHQADQAAAAVLSSDETLKGMRRLETIELYKSNPATLAKVVQEYARIDALQHAADKALREEEGQ